MMPSRARLATGRAGNGKREPAPLPAHGLEWTCRKQHHASVPTDLATATGGK